MGAGSFITTASVIAPAVLFEELELTPVQEETPKPPIVPPPALGGQPVTSAASGRARADRRGLALRVDFPRSCQERAFWRGAVHLRSVPAARRQAVRDSGAEFGAAARPWRSLFALAIPFTLTFTVPLGVLVGVLIALSRMSSDGEIIAMRACRSSQPQSDRAGTCCSPLWRCWSTATASLWLTPYSTWKTYKVLNQLVAAELTSEVQPQVFDEGFPNRILYISDVIPGAVARWRNVFIADTTPVEEQKKSDHDRGEGPTVTVAAHAIAVPDVAHNQIQLSLQDGATYDVGKDPADYYTTSAPTGAQILEATKPNEVHAKGYTEIDTIPLYRLAYHDKTLDPRQRDSGAHRAASAPGSAAGLFSAGSDRDSAGHILAQGWQIQRVRAHRRPGVRLLDGADRRPTAWPSSKSFRWASRCGSRTRSSPWSDCSC